MEPYICLFYNKRTVVYVISNVIKRLPDANLVWSRVHAGAGHFKHMLWNESSFVQGGPKKLHTILLSISLLNI